MFIYKGNTKIPVQLKDIISFGVIIDRRIDDLEAVVCSVFNCSENELCVKGENNSSKLMLCFLMYDVLKYSVHDIALKYQIKEEFLSLSITEIYNKCNHNKTFFKVVTSLKETYLLLNRTTSNA